MIQRFRTYRLLTSAVAGMLLFGLTAPALAAVCAHGAHLIAAHADACVCPLHAGQGHGSIPGHDHEGHRDVVREVSAPEAMPCHGSADASAVSTTGLSTASAGDATSHRCCFVDAPVDKATEITSIALEQTRVPADDYGIVFRHEPVLPDHPRRLANEATSGRTTAAPIYLLNAVFLI